MKAFVLREAGGIPEVQDFEEPEAKADSQLAVKVVAAALNPYDRVVAQNPGQVPRVMGLEAIIELGDGKLGYAGQMITPFGAIAERTLVKQDQVIGLPASLEPAAALTVGTSGLAAWLPLSWKAKLQPEESVLVLGATGVQGQLAVQAAKLLGAGHVVAAGRNRKTLEGLLEHGADAIAVLEGNLANALKDAAPENGYQVVVDSLFGPPFSGLLDSGTLREDSRVVVLGGSAGQEVTLAFRTLQDTRGATLAGYSSFHVPSETRREAYLAMVQHVRDGKLQVATKEFPLAQAAEAWKTQANGPHQKIVVTM